MCMPPLLCHSDLNLNIVSSKRLSLTDQYQVHLLRILHEKSKPPGRASGTRYWVGSIEHIHNAFLLLHYLPHHTIMIVQINKPIGPFPDIKMRRKSTPGFKTNKDLMQRPCDGNSLGMFGEEKESPWSWSRKSKGRMRAREINKASSVELGFYAKNNVNPAGVFQRSTWSELGC